MNNSFFIAEKRQRYHLCRKGVANNKNMIKDRTTKKKKKKNTIASTILYIFYVFVVVQSQLLYECEAYSKVLNPAKAYKQELDSIANNSESNEEDDFMAPSVNPNDYK